MPNVNFNYYVEDFSLQKLCHVDTYQNKKKIKNSEKSPKHSLFKKKCPSF